MVNFLITVLSADPPEFLLGILAWVSIIVGIIFLVKFFQISKDVREIKNMLETIVYVLHRMEKQ